MPIAINGSGTVTGISVGGLPDGIVDTDMIAANAVTAAKRGTGSVLQILQNTKTSTASTSSTTLQDTGLSQAITLTSASNKILVMYSLYMACVDGTYSGATSIIRGSSEIFIGDANGSAIRATSHYWPGHGYPMSLQSHTFLDTPGAGTHTYKIQYKAGYDGYSVYIGRPQQSSTSQYAGAVPSSLTLMEVAA